MAKSFAGTTSEVEKIKKVPKKFKTCGTNTEGEKDMLNAYKNWNERQFKAFTGVSEDLFKFLHFKTGTNGSTKMTDEESLLLFLMKLKLNLSFPVLASYFNVSEKTARRCFYCTLDLTYKAVKDYIIWLDKSTIQARLPASFKALFPNARVIIDASEIECQRPSTQHQRVQMYSNYKSRFTVKFLLGIAPSGEITFVSKAFGGRTTDTEITIKSGFIDLIEPGDEVLADKGFPHIETNLANNGGVLVMPPFKSGSKQFSEHENKSGYQIASVRIHVERCIARLKVFKILNFLPTHMLPYIDKILVIISFINNCSPDLIRQ
jgi:DDE superfamily endonuclease/Helix-turn-helix of DDE superfamily endonuclease